MTEPDAAAGLSLLGLEDELSCSICLSPFECPVTIPCGHNFCQDCLLATWKDSYVCPQCRTAFAARPELKKNTVLSAVVETFKARSGGAEAATGPGKEEEEEAAVRCDACMEAEAAQTCLTCMASFCEEHLRPHRDNPVFRPHRLIEPVGDLAERICPEHHKLMELFCSQHDCSICTFCLQHKHKGCCFTSQEEQRSRKESDLREKLLLLDGRIQKSDSVVFQISSMIGQLRQAASSRKAALAAVYQQIRDLLAQEERDAQREVDQELERSEKKLQEAAKNLTRNGEKMRKSKEALSGLLSRSQTPAFLTAAFEMPKVSKCEPHLPQVSLDSARVKATQRFAASLRDDLTEVLKQPVEDRPSLRPSGEKAAPQSGPSNTQSAESQQKSGAPKPQQRSKSRSKSPGRPPVQPLLQPFPLHPYPPMWNPQLHPRGPQPGPNVGPFWPGPWAGDPAFQETGAGMQWRPPSPRFPGPQGPPPAAGQKNKPAKAKQASNNQDVSDGKNRSRGDKQKTDAGDAALDITSAEKRNDLLKHGVQLALDPMTAHRRIALSADLTGASVSDEPAGYPDGPGRFAVCSQVLGSQGFSRGRHYWEVKISGHSFLGVGLAYAGIDRKTSDGRLGRNDQSWCVEWFNARVSAWHDNGETLLESVMPKRLGVLLDCEAGAATFYNVADRAYPFHTFVFPFTQPVYPAFWMFSNNSSISLCKMQA